MQEHWHCSNKQIRASWAQKTSISTEAASLEATSFKEKTHILSHTPPLMNVTFLLGHKRYLSVLISFLFFPTKLSGGDHFPPMKGSYFIVVALAIVFETSEFVGRSIFVG